jgi:hypothetical protein
MEVQKMPGFDGTGPNGTGPNGRGMGPCGGGTRGFFGGRGMRRGGHGIGWMRPATFSYADEESFLEQQKSWLEERLAAIKSNKKEN